MQRYYYLGLNASKSRFLVVHMFSFAMYGNCSKFYVLFKHEKDRGVAFYKGPLRFYKKIGCRKICTSSFLSNSREKKKKEEINTSY